MNAIISSGLLAASMIVGQTSEPPTSGKVIPPPAPVVVQAQAPQPTGPTIQQVQGQPPSRPVFGWFNRDDRPIMNKITTWWKRDPQEGKVNPNVIPEKSTVIRETPAIPVSKPTPAPTPGPTDFPRKLPNPQSKLKDVPTAESKVEQTTLQQTTMPKSIRSPINADLANKIGRDEKFEWITGQLEIENSNFVLYYATPETIDKLHGRIILVPHQADLKQFKKGDLVSVRGQLAQRQTLQGTVPVYRVTNASLIERPKN